MIAIVAAAGLSSLLSRDTIYTLKLRRRGIDIHRSRGVSLMQTLRVRDAMQMAPQPLSSNARLEEIAGRFAHRDVAALPVIDAQGRYCGTVTANEVERAMRDDMVDVTAEGLAALPAAVSPDMTPARGLAQLVRQDTAALPVIDPGSTIVLGWLNHRAILMAYSTHLENRPDI